MGQGHWIRESDGHYKHYTEEEYQKSSHGIFEKWSVIITFSLFVIGFVISLIVGIVHWIISLF